MLISKISELREWLIAGEHGIIGLVPTMGALHEGHLSLIGKARAECDQVIVSLFVNPLQFGAGEDFSKYPRDMANDLVLAEAAGGNIVFAPPTEEIVRANSKTRVIVDGLGEPLCGRSRPGHFEGVATIIVKLFNLIEPQRAYFGEKDWQQLLIVRQVAGDLDFPTDIIAVPTVRDEDGLALSSRNRYLSADERTAARALPLSLKSAANLIKGGDRDLNRVLAAAKEVIAAEPMLELEYLSIVRAQDLSEVTRVSGKLLIAGAVYIAKTRLIDNIVIEI